MADRPKILRTAQAALIAAGVVLMVGLLQLTGLLRLWELTSLDYRARWTLPPERKPEDPFVRPDLFQISVTDESLRLMDQEQHQPWPWDRETQSYLVKACTQGKAAAILYDFILSESEKTKGDDDCMVEALKHAPPTYFAGGFRETRNSEAKPREDLETQLARFSIEVDADDSVSVPERYQSVVFPISPFCEVLSGVCDISTPRDPDGIIRRYRLYSVFKGRAYPTFVLAALMAREKTRKVIIRDRVMTIGRLSFPVDHDASIFIRYYRPENSFAWKSAYKVFGGVIDLAAGKASRFDFRQLENCIVIIGTSAVGMTDLREIPVSRKPMPGPEIHLTALSNVLNRNYLLKAPGWVSVLLFSLAALGIAMSTRFASAVWGGVLAAGALAGVVGGATLLFRTGWIVDLVPLMLVIVLAFSVTSAVNFLHEGRQRQQVKRTFAQYVSPRVVEKILRQPDSLHLDGERKVVTIFFLDFAGFTSMSEKLDPSDLVKLISEYHNETAEEIFRTEGTLDKFIGDAIMAFWNDPIEQSDHSLRACRTAIGAQKRLAQMAQVMRERGLPEMSARIGINTGVATVGAMGARGQVNYTLIGDEVNLASRLEGVNKEFGTKIIVSESTYLPAKDALEVRELALIKVKGKKQPVRIYELIGLRGEAPPERLELVQKFDAALGEFRARRFSRAWEMFLSLSQKGDQASEVYVGVCERYMSEPPPADWDASYQMDHK